MSYAIAAAGTGGHVFPGLAVAEALVAAGVTRRDIVFVGGDRLEATVYPEEGFPFVQLQLRGLRRSLSPANLALPYMVLAAASTARREMQARGVRVVLGMGSYVTVPAGWAARRLGLPLYLHEQNAEAGLANRLMAGRAAGVLVSFVGTKGLRRSELVGNPVRYSLARFSRPELRHLSFQRYGLNPGPVTVGVFGGSLGAGAINQAVDRLAGGGHGLAIQILHLAGRAHEAGMRKRSEGAEVPWIVLGFEEEMQYFYAACDLVVARAGGAVAEIAATGTPAVLVPGRFGGGHQMANARRFESEGAAVVLEEERLHELAEVMEPLVRDRQGRRRMGEAMLRLSHPEAAARVAAILEGAHG